MLESIVIFVTAAVVQSAAVSEAICDVGRVALSDLPTTKHLGTWDTYYAGSDRYHRDLLDVCPKLRSELPTRYPLADDAARNRAYLSAPIPGQYTEPAVLYSISVPEISSDLKTAIVRFNVTCTGNCGGVSEGRYVRTFKGWQLEGKIRALYVY